MKTIESEIPEKYKGKSLDDLINMHVNVEKVMRRQGNELGQLRGTVDAQSRLIESLKVAPAAPSQVKPPEPLTAERLLNDPEKALNTVLEPQVQAQNTRLDRMEMTLARQDFEKQYPSYMQDVNDSDFQEWVLGSKTRSKLLVKLHQGYDYESGKELWELWSEHKNATKAAEAARQGKIQAATTIKGGSGDQPIGKPTYSRAKLAELQIKAMNGDPSAQARWNDPEFQREYQDAYREGRVK